MERGDSSVIRRHGVNETDDFPRERGRPPGSTFCDRPIAIVVQPVLGAIERASDPMVAESLLQVLELFPGPALIVGPSGDVLGANDRAGRWIGPGRDRLVGRPLARFVAEPPERVAGFLEECAGAGRPVAGTLTPPKDGGAGESCRVEGIAVRDPTPDGGDRPPMIVVHVVSPDGPGGGRDDAAAALREQVRRGDELLDQLAHDLRNPVAAISGAMHLVRTATAPEDVAWARDAMERQLRQVVHQLDDLLDFTRITRGKCELKKQRLAAAAAARSVAAAARPLVDERGAKLTVTTAPGDLAVDADPARLEQMLLCLVGDVAGSAEPGSSIRLSVARERDTIVFRVADQREDGPPEDPDPRAAGGSPRRGRSLALTLAGKLAELHGGSASDPGEGNALVVRLPAASVAANAVDAHPVGVAQPAAAAGSRILVVDDNVDTARGTARLLELAGYDVRVAHDGREALEIALEQRPRFILLDISLPVMDGYEVARQLRGDPRHAGVTIIAISGYSADDILPPHEAGFDDHLVKPVDFDALRAILASA